MAKRSRVVAPMQPIKRKSSRPLFIAAGLILLAWLVFIIASIQREVGNRPDSPESLAVAVEANIRAGDAGAMQSLLWSNTAGEEYAAQLLDEMKTIPQGDIQAKAVSGDIVLRIRTNPPLCIAWRAVKEGDKWLLDVVPPTSGPACS
ncbi:hypothetical protein [Microtetraspora malaysiensis]|uniref:hypothetical protein n=1 Tax=Microtetraspora malaysiensis TaxID=161358 RepID=UPI003D8C4A86